MALESPVRFARPAVEWRDLVAVSPREAVGELLLPLPWFLGSLVLASLGLWPLALGASFAFFLCGLRVVHNAFHQAVGLPRRANEALLFAMSVGMLSSMHAVRYHHLRHHTHCLQAEDLEAASARMPAWKALAFGPLFPLLLHGHALKAGGSVGRWTALELAAMVGLVIVVWHFMPWAPLLYHLAAMAVGQCMTAFFAVWTVHHDCDDPASPPPDRPLLFARTQRGHVKNLVSYAMFLHAEHHLFPAVPTRRLRELARRLDAVAPEYATLQVF